MTKALTERWNGLERDALAGLTRGRPSSPFGLVDGRLDLRGLPLGSVSQLKKVTLTGADLSYADMEQVRLQHCRLADVILDNVDARNFSDHGNVFRGCRFERTNLAGSAIGFDGSRYEHCWFGRTRLTRAVFARAEFDDCTFEDCVLDGVDFNASSFERCVFRGPVKDVWFRGGYAHPAEAKRLGKSRPNQMRDVDFTAATLVDVTFSDGCDVSTLLLPDDGSVVRLDRWRARIDGAVAVATDEDIALFLASYRPHAQTQEEYVLAVADLERELGRTRADEALRLLRDAL